jgi:pyruvate-formate lyase-activating enzyme
MICNELASRLKVVNFLASNLCNIRCRSCINGDAIYSRKKLPVETALALLDQAAAVSAVKSVHFSGGEPFLFRDFIRDVARHASCTYGWRSAATTNCFWSKSVGEAIDVLVPLKDAGLAALGVSVDEFHEEFVPLDRVRNCLLAAQQLGLVCRIQAAVVRGARHVADYREALGVDDETLFHWQDVQCVPLGYARDHVPTASIEGEAEIPMGDCTIGGVITLFPSGDLTLCSTSRHNPALVVGRLPDERLQTILERADRLPLINALMLWWGPRLLGEILREAGHPEYASAYYNHACHACYSILEDPQALSILEARLADLADDLRQARIEMHQSLDEQGARRPWAIRIK